MARDGTPRRRDVAELAGVSPSTVSIVLNNTPGTRVPEATRKRVLDAAKKLSYQPSAVARALASGRTMTIGVSIHFLGTPFGHYTSHIMNGFWSVVKPEGFRLLVDVGAPGRCVCGFFRGRQVDAIVVLAPHRKSADTELDSLVKARFPIVYIGAKPEVAWGDYADLDNREAGRTVTKALIDAGHRKILHLSGPTEVNSSAIGRLEGYKDALREAGIRARNELIMPGDYGPMGAERGITAALKSGVAFTGIFAATTAMANKASEMLKARGVEIPGDVSIAGINLEPEDMVNGVRFTTIEQPLWDIGEAAGRMLMDRVAGSDAAPREKLLKGRFVEGATIARAPG